MAVKLAYNRVEQFANGTGVPLSGAKLFTYVAGSVNTKQTTYTESTGVTQNTNPIVLDSSGNLPQPIWLTTGASYKFVLAPSTDTDPPTSPIWSLDNITGINDTTLATSEWTLGPTPTFVSASQFTLVGDQTSTFAKSRRIKATVTAGTVYGAVTATAFGALTTVTVALDSGALDSGLSSVSYGIVAPVNPSINADEVHRKGTAVASAATTDIWSIAGDYVHVTGSTGPITSFGTAPYAGVERTVVFDSTPTITHNATTLVLPGGANIVAAAGDTMIVRADTTANMVVIEYSRASGVPSVGTQTANTVFSGPASGSAAAPTFRAMVIADLPAAVTTIVAPTALPSANSIDLINIPQTYSALLLVINGASFDVDARIALVRASINNGSSFDSTAASYQGSYIGNGVAGENDLATLQRPNQQLNALLSSSEIVISGYTGSPNTLMAVAAGHSVSGAEFFSSNIRYLNTAAVNALQITMNGAGNFDAGTYALYGLR